MVTAISIYVSHFYFYVNVFKRIFLGLRGNRVGGAEDQEGKGSRSEMATMMMLGMLDMRKSE